MEVTQRENLVLKLELTMSTSCLSLCQARSLSFELDPFDPVSNFRFPS